MVTTFILSLIMMAGFFLMLYSAVALIQDKKYFTSAPKDIQEAVRPKEERFPGQHMIGSHFMAVSIVLLAVPMFYGAMDGVWNGFSFGQFVTRFLIMLLGLKTFDVLFFDWYLLCHSNFFPHYYPEVKDLVGPHQFGFNKRFHIITALLCVPASCFMAWFCTLFTH